MAFRTATVHVLVAILLVCPFICMSEAAAAGHQSQAVRKRSCCCCSQSIPENGKNRPGKPDSQQGSGTCLCHGAVMDRQVIVPEVSHEIIASVVLGDIFLTQQLSACGPNYYIDRLACHFPVVESGKEIRALIASFLL